MTALLKEISACSLCMEHLENGPRPVVSFSPKSKILIIGQAPGLKVHRSGIPWDDKSGEQLRDWMGVDEQQFYNPDVVGIVPMGFCYPGKGKSGDLPPRKECAPLWHPRILEQLTNVKLTLLIGQYAQNHYLANRKKNLTETVKSYQEYLPQFIVLPHPSPRNFIWQSKNAWFVKEVVPLLRQTVSQVLR